MNKYKIYSILNWTLLAIGWFVFFLKQLEVAIVIFVGSVIFGLISLVEIKKEKRTSEMIQEGERA